MYKRSVCLIFIALISCSAKPAASSWRDLFFGTNWNQKREAKFLPLFALSTIGVATCAAPSGEIGSCLPNKDCILRNGIPGGPCAGGYGVCCVFLQTCNGIIRENSTYFVNPNHPDIYDSSGNCQVTVQKLLPDICQLRLDFDIFTISPPEPVNHLCNQDQLVVSGGSPTPIICGTSTNDHSKFQLP